MCSLPQLNTCPVPPFMWRLNSSDRLKSSKVEIFCIQRLHRLAPRALLAVKLSSCKCANLNKQQRWLSFSPKEAVKIKLYFGLKSVYRHRFEKSWRFFQVMTLERQIMNKNVWSQLSTSSCENATAPSRRTSKPLRDICIYAAWTVTCLESPSAKVCVSEHHPHSSVTP